MPLIRDTIDPTREREVPDEEALDLDRMGLLLTGTRARTDEGLRAAALRQVLGRQADAVDAVEVVDDRAAGEEPVDGPTDPGDAPDSPTPDPHDSQES